MTATLTATMLGLGYMRGAPGTWGSLAALPLAWGVHLAGGFPLLVVATIALFGLGLWAVAQYPPARERHDPSEVVVDEVVGQWVALLVVSYEAWRTGLSPLQFPAGWGAAFVLFRLFDIVKIGPVKWADARNDAFGVMLDDAIAGAMAAGLVALVLYGVGK